MLVESESTVGLLSSKVGTDDLKISAIATEKAAASNRKGDANS